MQTQYPICPVRLKKGHEESVIKGMPWIYAGDLIDSSEPLLAPAGSLVSIENHKGQRLGTGYFNARSQIACRVLTLKQEPINTDFFTRRFEQALSRRSFVQVPYYRWVHAESDALPGLLVDRFGPLLVCQVGTAGMEQLQPLWLEALEQLVKPKAILMRNDVASRSLEGLPRANSLVKGTIPDRVPVVENGFTYLADLKSGQKTGWFYDQRDNRAMIAALAEGKSVLDVYSHSGGFGLLSARNGASQVVLADSSALALSLAKEAASLNGIACEIIAGDALGTMAKLREEGRQFDIVLADPPAFVKSKKDVAAGMKGYQKVTKAAAALVRPGGLLFTASCSHHATRPRFNQSVLAGIASAGRQGRVLKQTGASLDHPCHPALPQSEYLKGILLEL